VGYKTLDDDIRKRVAALLASRSPYGGRLKPELPSDEITEILRQDRDDVDQKTVEGILVQFAAVGFVWLSISVGHTHKMAVSAVFYPYGLRLIA
jgi:hypothetical protein